MYFVDVILPLSLSKTFTYSVSEAEYNYIKKGMRVAVPLKNKTYTGLAVEIHTNKPILYEPKEINQILDEIPIVNEIQIEHWFWIASYYMCAIGDVYRCALPSSFLLENETVIAPKKNNFIDKSKLSDEEFLIFEALEKQAILKIEDSIKILNKKNVFPVIQKMIDKGLLVLKDEIQEKYTPKRVRYIKLNEKYLSNDGLSILLETLKNATKQKEVVLSYFQISATEKKPISVKKLIEVANSNTSILKSLLEKEVFEEYYIQVDRDNFFEKTINKKLELSPVQQETLNKIKTFFNEKNICLLHGLTSSGKTEIYIELIASYLENNKQVLYLLPEIALTTQLVARLREYFGSKIAIFHSKYSNNERVETWKKVAQNSPKAQIVIGARSSLFLPFSNLGLIIIDEEHEVNFKQVEPSPRYNARDAATILARMHKSKVLLGSATPSIESYYNTQCGKYGLVELFERYKKTKLPLVELVDLKDKYFRKQMVGHFSDILIEKITAALSLGEQIILFQNRRGYSPILECISCGHIPQCTQCDVSLTYHKYKNQLRCHYCGYNLSKPTNCHVCSSTNLTTKGFGTEQIQMELLELFPEAKISRMDQDTTKAKFSFEKILDSFKNREIDILVGTQMLAKGLDFENVSLVGIMNADAMLYFPDFRAFERSFQMMTQLAGRSGRSEKQGTVIIQTYNPNHPTIKQVVSTNYLEMYKEQVYERQIYKYPPFYKIIKLSLKHRDFEKLKEGAIWLYEMLQKITNILAIGPEEPPISRIRNEYIRTIMIKIPQKQSVEASKKNIQKVLNSFETISQYKSIKVIINVDF